MSKRTWLLGAVLAACTNAHGPKTGTQTGNPPVLDEGRVTLAVSADQVHITGKPGAVTPGGATIEITNLATGKVIEGQAAADGSFDLRVDGSLNDTFVVRVLSGGEASSPVYIVRGGASVTGQDGGSLSCEQYTELAEAAIAASAASAERSCSSDGDCTTTGLGARCVPDCGPAYVTSAGAAQIQATAQAVSEGLCATAIEAGCSFAVPRCPAAPPASCVAGQCMPADALSCSARAQLASERAAAAIADADTSCERDSDCVGAGKETLCQLQCGSVAAVSRTGQAQIEAAIAEVNASLCADFTDECPRGPVGCDPIAPPPPRCEAGQCTLEPAPDTGIPDCTTCFTETLQWGWNGVGEGPGYQDLSELAPCARYTHRRLSIVDPGFGDIASCSGDFVACNAIASTGAVMAALSNADVQRALAESPVLYGIDPRGVDGAVYRIVLGEQMIEVGGSCANGPQTCVSAPEGVQQLVQLLMDIDIWMLLTEECAEFPR